MIHFLEYGFPKRLEEKKLFRSIKLFTYFLLLACPGLIVRCCCVPPPFYHWWTELGCHVVDLDVDVVVVVDYSLSDGEHRQYLPRPSQWYRCNSGLNLISDRISRQISGRILIFGQAGYWILYPAIYGYKKGRLSGQFLVFELRSVCRFHII